MSPRADRSAPSGPRASLTAAVSVDPGTIGAGTTASVIVSVPGASISDNCVINFQGNLPSDILVAQCYCTAGGVLVTLYNSTGAPVAPGAMNARVRIFRARS